MIQNNILMICNGIIVERYIMGECVTASSSRVNRVKKKKKSEGFARKYQYRHILNILNNIIIIKFTNSTSMIHSSTFLTVVSRLKIGGFVMKS